MNTPRERHRLWCVLPTLGRTAGGQSHTPQRVLRSIRITRVILRRCGRIQDIKAHPPITATETTTATEITTATITPVGIRVAKIPPMPRRKPNPRPVPVGIQRLRVGIIPCKRGVPEIHGVPRPTSITANTRHIRIPHRRQTPIPWSVPPIVGRTVGGRSPMRRRVLQETRITRVIRMPCGRMRRILHRNPPHVSSVLRIVGRTARGRVHMRPPADLDILTIPVTQVPSPHIEDIAVPVRPANGPTAVVPKPMPKRAVVDTSITRVIHPPGERTGGIRAARDRDICSRCPFSADLRYSTHQTHTTG